MKERDGVFLFPGCQGCIARTEYVYLVSLQIPFTFMSKGEGYKILESYLLQKQQVLKEIRAVGKIRHALYNTADLLPGVHLVSVSMSALY